MNGRGVIRGGVLLCIVLVVGCAGKPDWPAEPEQVVGPASNPTSVLWRPGPAREGRYLQTLRDGVKRVLYREVGESGEFGLLADLDEVDPATLRMVFVLLDGVPYGLMEQMYREGRFRLFFPPAKMVGPFPTLTDISFSNMFGVPGVSCYESVVFNRRTNRLYDATKVYLAGDNELWATGLDYRQALWVDGVSYVWPMFSTRREFAAMFKRVEEILADKPDQRDIVVYSISTDSACHMVPAEKVRRLLAELDRYIERLIHDHPGRVGVVMLADHGNNMIPNCRRVAIDEAVKAAGLKPVFDRGFKGDRDVVIPRYGLISFARAFCQDDEQRGELIEALRAVEGVEHVVWMNGERVHIVRGDQEAVIRRRLETGEGGAVEEFFSYTPTRGDPLELVGRLRLMTSHTFSDEAGLFYRSADLLAATVDHTWPDPLWRIWHGLTDQTAVAADVAVSLGPGWYYGSTGLDRFAKLNGTHGGLWLGDSLTFFMTTVFEPPPVMRTTDVPAVINEHWTWTPRTADPKANGLHKYLGDEP